MLIQLFIHFYFIICINNLASTYVLCFINISSTSTSHLLPFSQIRIRKIGKKMKNKNKIVSQYAAHCSRNQRVIIII